jgi:hypothetical protein
MDTLDPAGEFLRISERYRQMSDDELLVLIPQSSELTPFAQQALANEVRSRGLKAEIEDEDKGTSARPPFKESQFKPPSVFLVHESPKFRESADDDFPGSDSSSDPDSYQDDRSSAPYGACATRSRYRRFSMKPVFPFFMGPEKATGVDEVTSNFIPRRSSLKV